MTRYRWVDSRKAEGFAVTDACAVAQVSTSAFYAWHATASRGPTSAELEQAYLTNAIIGIHRDSGGTYGAPRVTAALRQAGWAGGRKRAERLMRDNNVVGAPAAQGAHHHPRRAGAAGARPARARIQPRSTRYRLVRRHHVCAHR